MECLAPFHDELHNWWTRPEAKPHQLTLIPRDHSKALTLDQRVLTPTGWVPTGELKVGDEVIGSDGKPTKVIQLHPIADLPIYKVSTRDGRSVKCSDKHL